MTPSCSESPRRSFSELFDQIQDVGGYRGLERAVIGIYTTREDDSPWKTLIVFLFQPTRQEELESLPVHLSGPGSQAGDLGLPHRHARLPPQLHVLQRGDAGQYGEATSQPFGRQRGRRDGASGTAGRQHLLVSGRQLFSEPAVRSVSLRGADCPELQDALDGPGPCR